MSIIFELFTAGLCQDTLKNDPESPFFGLEAQGEGLGRLLWLYLRLLLTRQAIDRIVRESTDSAEEGSQLEDRVHKLEAQLANGSVGEELRRSRMSGCGTDGVAQLKAENDELRLYLAALLRLLTSKGVVTREELARVVEIVDAEDGCVDGRFTGSLT